MSEIGNKQSKFAKYFAMLILHMIAEGYEPRFAPDGLKHMDGSLHGLSLAHDVNLFKAGVWLKKTEDHRAFGAWWCALDPDNAWGGDWGDGNHYSIKHQGRK